MKVAIATDGGMVSAHFGRCPVYTLVEIENQKFIKKEIVENPGHEPGFLPQFLHGKGAQCIVVGGMGARAQRMFEEKQISIVMGIEGKIDTVIERLCGNSLAGGESLCKPGAGKGYGFDKTGCDHGEHQH